MAKKNIFARSYPSCRFQKKVDDYLLENEGKTRWIKDPDGKPATDGRGKPLWERCVMSVPGFCRYAKIDDEDDFIKIITASDKHKKAAKKLLTAIKDQAIQLAVNDKNNNYLSVLNKTYFDDEKPVELLTPLPEDVKKDKKVVDIKDSFANMSVKERVEFVQALRELKK